MHLQRELLFHQLGQLRETQARLRCALLGHELENRGGKLVSAPGTPLVGQQSGQAALRETHLRLVKRRPGEAKLARGLRNRPLLHADLAQHLVLDLQQIVGIEEVAGLEERVSYILRTRIESSLLAKGL